jgi:hypothetical protein
VNREIPARFCERLWVKSLGPTLPLLVAHLNAKSILTYKGDPLKAAHARTRESEKGYRKSASRKTTRQGTRACVGANAARIYFFPFAALFLMASSYNDIHGGFLLSVPGVSVCLGTGYPTVFNGSQTWDHFTKRIFA